MKKLLSYKKIGLLMLFCLMISVRLQPISCKAEQAEPAQGKEEETKEYEEYTVYIGNEFRIPILEGDSDYFRENGYYCDISKDWETQEYVIYSERESDLLFHIVNEEQGDRKFLLHFVYGPYRWSTNNLQTLQKKSTKIQISGLTAEELDAVAKGEQVKVSKTGDTLTKLEFFLEHNSFLEDETEVIFKKYIKNGKIYFKFLKEGTFTLRFRLTAQKKKQEIYYEDYCTVVVEAVGFPNQPFAVAVGGSRPAPLKNYTEVTSYTSSDESIAVVGEDGTIRGIAAGEAVITAKGITVNKTEETTQCIITITKPKINEKLETIIPVYGSHSISLSGLESYSEVVVTSSKPEILRGGGGTYYGAYYEGVSGGTAKLTITVDGKKLYSKKITVYDPKLPELAVISVGQKSEALMNIKLPSKESSISYFSSDWDTVNVNKSLGRIKGAKEGRTEVKVVIDDFKFTVPVLVVSNKKIAKAANFGIQAIGTPYSQEKRMKEGYFDCSSFVWRAYKAANVAIGGSSTYAPTAANMAKYMVEHKQEIKDVTQIKPGDLIFNGGDDNSRYRGIWHVSMILWAEEATNFWTGETGMSLILIEAGGGGVYVSSSYMTQGNLDSETLTIARPIS